MKKINSPFPLTMWAALAVCAFSSAAQANDRPAKFGVAAPQIQALGIQTMQLQNQSDAMTATFPAQVIVPPTAEKIVSSPVTGLVAQLLVQQNQLVKPGTPLIRIASMELGQLQLQLLQASSRATLARQAAQRERQLFDEGIIPQRRVQETQAALKESEAALNHAKAMLRLSGMSATTIERIAASGKLQDSITLSATQAGIVTEISVKPGQRIEAATALMNVAQTELLWLDIQLPASENTHKLAGTKIKVQGRDITARILSASPTVSSSSQTVMLRAAIEGKTDQIRPGEFVTVELPVAAMQGSWDVPLSAVAHDGKQAYVFARTSDGFEARPVTITTSAGQRVRMQGQLKAGEHIAVSGVVALKGAWLDGKGSK
ncbi:efflux RND transporter periplasmic adaptor subunit [Herminiimonas sp.]|uniref:efflux RND transporter periplasmic adaptor subunit n=1 Tax=Herminiimonas sp. TaxID=1926289 RepID=UPI0027210EF4|nr:efflux RND transporter periplasmic adaptor subunit [Herminiimonas sp.]MDO8305569.1 efflux RND transporter periplasmic adaptor subunit [Herminiimonas sp.]